MQTLLQKAQSSHTLTREEIISLLQDADSQSLFRAADQVRSKYIGDGSNYLDVYHF